MSCCFLKPKYIGVLKYISNCSLAFAAEEVIKPYALSFRTVHREARASDSCISTGGNISLN